MPDDANTAEVTRTIERWTLAVQRGKISEIVANHPDDVLMFDVNGPLQWQGLDEYRKTWEYFFKFGEPAEDLFVIEELAVTAGDDVAFATGLLRIGGSAEPICRLTLGLRKEGDHWVIAHEHHSSADPFDEPPQ
ncbi:YybH family protein [Tsuneonella sp. HG094]